MLLRITKYGSLPLTAQKTTVGLPKLKLLPLVCMLDHLRIWAGVRGWNVLQEIVWHGSLLVTAEWIMA